MRDMPILLILSILFVLSKPVSDKNERREPFTPSGRASGSG
jgi:hypothetical protein